MVGNRPFGNNQLPRYFGITQSLIEQVDNVQLTGRQPVAIDRANRAGSTRDRDVPALPFPRRCLQGRGRTERGQY